MLAVAIQATPAEAACKLVTGSPLPPQCSAGVDCSCLLSVDKSCHPTGKLLDAFVSRGACLAFGGPLNLPRPRLAFGGHYQTFFRGEIAHYSTFPQGASTPDFVLSAHTATEPDPNDPSKTIPVIVAEWGPTAPFSYDSFILRWDLENHDAAVEAQHEDDAQQLEVDDSGDRGRATFPASSDATYRIYVEGCDDTFLGKDCDQGWSFPVYVDKLPRATVAVPQPATNPAAFRIAPGQIIDVPDSIKVPFEQQIPIVARMCNSGTPREEDKDNDHFGELNGDFALARLQAADLLEAFQTQGAPALHAQLRQALDVGSHCAGMDQAALREEVSKAILDSDKETRPGTDVSGLVRAGVAAALGMSVAALLLFILIPFSVAALTPIAAAMSISVAGLIGALLLPSEPGDYDMRLVDYLRIYHLFGSDISTEARDHLRDRLLSVRGGEDERAEFLYLSGLPTPIPETENHIWMTESSRYLTNNILLGQGYDQEYDNDLNGMTDWVLAGLQQFLIEDFYELNSRPYARIVYGAIQNLYDFAAFGVTCSLAPNAPPQSRRCDVKRAARNVLDFLNVRFALSSDGLRRAVPFRRQPDFDGYPRLLTNGGDDMTWVAYGYVGGSDFLRDERNSLIMEGADGTIMSVFMSRYRPPLPVTDLMRDPGSPHDLDVQRFRSRARGSETAEVYFHGHDFLISGGGRHDHGRGFVSYFFPDERAIALPTTLMPSRQGDDYRDFVRIEGSTNHEVRSNLCVGPSFACGMNPALPPGLPDACKVTEGNWTFVDFTLNTPECPFGFNYYVAFYQEACSDDDCREAAGDDGNESFGFFEATPWRSFETYRTEVLQKNEPEDFVFDKVNVYRSPTGRIISFIVKSDDENWDIVGLNNAGSAVSLQRSFDEWQIAEGPLVSSPQKACIFIDNLFLAQRVILDHTDVTKPRRAVIEAAMSGRCSCPLQDYCLSPRAE